MGLVVLSDTVYIHMVTVGNVCGRGRVSEITGQLIVDDVGGL